MPIQFLVTEKAMRPASPKRQCFYCQQPIGSPHREDCVLVSKMVKIRMTVEYEINVPSTAALAVLTGYSMNSNGSQRKMAACAES